MKLASNQVLKNYISILVAAVLFSTSTPISTAKADFQQLSEAQIFRRCYSQFTRMALSYDDTRLAKAREGKAKASELCMSLFDQARLNSSLLQNSKTNPLAEEEAKSILRNFQSFHLNWFPAYDAVRFERDFATSQIYDLNEMAYHLTIALLAPNRKYREIVTGKNQYSAIRAGGPPKNFLDSDQFGSYYPLSKHKGWRTGDAVPAEWTPEQVQFGKLLGFKINNRSIALTYKQTKEMEPYHAVPGQGFDNSGVLSSSSYLLLNSTLKTISHPDGLINSHRNWSRAVFNDLLCRSLPVLTEEDVEKEVQLSSPARFRNESSCMRCHSTIDPLAAVLRNHSISPAYNDMEYRSAKMITTYQVTKDKGPISPEKADYGYNHQPPEGTLKYRDYRGQLVEKPLKNLRELGISLADSDDLYICAAKRYFEFFTGINVKIDARIDSNPSSNEKLKNRKFQDYVIQLGLDLKKKQSLRLMVQSIISSEFYRQKNYGIQP